MSGGLQLRGRAGGRVRVGVLQLQLQAIFSGQFCGL